MRRKGVTSIELAKIAGVSSATISRAFSANSRISTVTRERILSIAREHNYHPNAVARSLNNRQSRLVALVVNTIANPCEAEDLNTLVHRLQQHERMPLVLCCADHNDRNQLMRLASAYQVEHVVLFSDMVSIAEAVDIFRSATPIIASFEPVSAPSLACVRIDGAAASTEVVDRLVADGRRSFAYISGRASSWVDKKRRGWFSDALAPHGLAFEAGAQGDYSYDSGYKEAVMLLRRRRVDAVICGNDVMAIGVRDAAERLLGLNVPKNLAIVGHDGISMGTWESHSITTVAFDRVAYFDAIVDFIEREDEAHGSNETVMPCHVRWGSST